VGSTEDPWQQVRTRNGLAADEVISGLQKSIRRSDVDEAVAFAWEMYLTSPELEDFLWLRLQVISVEDIGFGEVNAPVLVDALNRMRREFAQSAPDRPLFFVHAVRYLCAQPKDRSSDMLRNIVELEFDRGRRPVIRDHMLDMHTRRGQQLGRGIEHFLDEASVVAPRKPGAHEQYELRLRALIGGAPSHADRAGDGSSVRGGVPVPEQHDE